MKRVMLFVFPLLLSSTTFAGDDSLPPLTSPEKAILRILREAYPVTLEWANLQGVLDRHHGRVDLEEVVERLNTLGVARVATLMAGESVQAYRVRLVSRLKLEIAIDDRDQGLVHYGDKQIEFDRDCLMMLDLLLRHNGQPVGNEIWERVFDIRDRAELARVVNATMRRLNARTAKEFGEHWVAGSNKLMLRVRMAPHWIEPEESPEVEAAAPPTSSWLRSCAQAVGGFFGFSKPVPEL